MAAAAAEPQILTVCEAAALLNVNEQTIQGWIDAESIPYVVLPSDSYWIPQGALLASLRSSYDLAAELREFDERNAEVTRRPGPSRTRGQVGHRHLPGVDGLGDYSRSGAIGPLAWREWLDQGN